MYRRHSAGKRNAAEAAAYRFFVRKFETHFPSDRIGDNTPSDCCDGLNQ
jgi:hypothetical protein